MTSTTYPLTSVLWPSEGVIQVFALDETRLALFSVQFLRTGRVQSWDYIHLAVASCILEQDIQLFHDKEAMDTAIDYSTTPSACSVYCRTTGTSLRYDEPHACVY